MRMTGGQISWGIRWTRVKSSVIRFLKLSRVKHHSLGGFRKNLQCSLNQGKNKEMAPHMSFLMSWLIFCIIIMPKILRQKKLLAFKEAPRLSL